MSPEGLPISMCSYALLLDEMTTLIKGKDERMMDALKSFFDCPRIFTYSTLAREDARIENLCLTLLAGTTPKTMSAAIGKEQIGQGFTSRCNFIYSDAVQTLEVFKTKEKQDWGSFEEDLTSIYSLHGHYQFTREAGDRLQALIDSGIPPSPTDGRLEEYNSRRGINLIKLSMIYAASESSVMLIRTHHVEKALETLLEAEVYLPEAFALMGNSDSFESIRLIHSWMTREFEEAKKPIHESIIKRKLISELNPRDINTTLAELVSSGYISLVGDKSYIPNKV
jgi:hypothetical protein